VVQKVKQVDDWRENFADWECKDCGEIWMDFEKRRREFDPDPDADLDDYCPDSAY